MKFIAVRCPDIKVVNLQKNISIFNSKSHESRNESGYYYGDIVELECSKGRAFGDTNTTELSINCLSDGRWDKPISQCLGKAYFN